MLHKRQFLFCVLFCLVNSYEKVPGFTCPMAKIDSNYRFYGIFRHRINAPLKIAWLKDGKDVSHCIPGLNCSDTNEVKTTTTLKDLGNGNYEIQLVVLNITTEYAGLWSLEYFGTAIKYNPEPIFSCQLKLAGDNVNEVDSKPSSAQLIEKNPSKKRDSNESGDQGQINIFVIIGVVLCLFVGISLLINLYIKHSKDPYQHVAKAKEITKKSTLKDETSTRCPNIVSDGWSKFNHLIAKIFSSTKKASNVSDDYNRYTSIQCTQESHVPFPASEL